MSTGCVGTVPVQHRIDAAIKELGDPTLDPRGIERRAVDLQGCLYRAREELDFLALNSGAEKLRELAEGVENAKAGSTHPSVYVTAVETNIKRLLMDIELLLGQIKPEELFEGYERGDLAGFLLHRLATRWADGVAIAEIQASKYHTPDQYFVEAIGWLTERGWIKQDAEEGSEPIYRITEQGQAVHRWHFSL